MSKWSCYFCTFKNQKTCDNCQICARARPQNCRACTYLNQPNAKTCEMCNIQMNGMRTISCPNCTYKNPHYTEFCQMCQNSISKPYEQQLRSQQRSHPSFQLQYPKYLQNNTNPNNSAPIALKNCHKKDSNREKNRRTQRKKPKPQYSNRNPDTQETEMFRDVKSIIDKENNEIERIREEEKQVEELKNLYEQVMIRKNAQIDKIIDYLTKFVPQKQPSQQQNRPQQCQACYCDFTDSGNGLCVKSLGCGHASLCVDCFCQFLSIRVREDDVTPWIICPAENCKYPIDPYLLKTYLSPQEKKKFARSFIRKNLARNPNWIFCKTDKCEYGFKVIGKMENPRTLECAKCKRRQSVSKNLLTDNSFQELLQNGAMRLCPKCKFFTFKDKGICNVIQCGQCSIWWNWRTRETGNSSSELKNRARQSSTLWEPGELQYQQNLQVADPNKFKELLEKNGVQYNPNYIRGS